MKLVHRALVAVLALLWALPSESSAQIFLASKPHPDFAVGPLFVIANVRPDLSVTVNISFSLTLRPGAAHATMEQDLFLLWPAEVAEPTAAGPADPTLARGLHDHLVVLSSGRLKLQSRDRTLVGPGQPGQPRQLHQDSVDAEADRPPHRDHARHAAPGPGDAQARELGVRDVLGAAMDPDRRVRRPRP